MTRAFLCDGCREFKEGEPIGHYIKNDAHLSNNKLTSGHLDFETIREYCDECTYWIDTHQPPPKYARKKRLTPADGTISGNDNWMKEHFEED